MTHVMLVDNQKLVRTVIARQLETIPEIEIFEADSYEESISILRMQKIDLMIIEIGIPEGEALIEAQKNYPEVKIIVLSEIGELRCVQQMFNLGVSAYLLKECLSQELPIAIDCASRGRRYICSGIASMIPLPKLMPLRQRVLPELILTRREIEVLELLEKGLTNQQISEKLFLSRRTVEGHRQILLEKTGSRNTANLVSFAIRNGYLS